MNPFKKKNKQVFKDDLVQEVNKEFERRKSERNFIELQWRLNMNFYEGNQFMYINNRTKSIEDTEKVYWYQEVEVFNQIAPIIETRLSKLGRLRPIPKTRPATDTEEDVNNSKISNKILETTYYDKNLKDVQSTANTWSEITGTVIFKTTWNQHLGEEIANINGMKLCEGDIDPVAINPFEIYPDSIWKEEVTDLRSIIHARAMSVNSIKEKWGIEVPGEEVNVLTVEGSDISYQNLGNKSSGNKITNRKIKDSAIVMEYWEIPTKEYPNGRLIITTKEKLLYFGDLPYKVGENNSPGLPFIAVKSIKVPGRFFGKSVIERLIPIQRRYNSLKNRKAEFFNRVTIGQIVYEEGSIDPDFLEEEGTSPGLMIPYKRGFNPPRYMEFHPLPSAIEKEEHNLLNDFVRISGVSELAKDSQAPVGVKSGVALGILQEQDDTKLSLTASYIAEGNVKLGKHILRLYKEFADTDRVLRSVGNNLETELITWNNSNITSDDVYIDSYAQSLDSLAQRRNMVFDLLQTGLFIDPETGRMSKEMIAKVFDMIDLGNWEVGSDSTRLHLDKAKRENLMFTKGNFKPIDSFDDHIIHIKSHNEFRLTPDYDNLRMVDPEIDQIFEYHVNQHIQFIQDRMGENEGGQNEERIEQNQNEERI